MEQLIICPNCGATAAILSTPPAEQLEPTDNEISGFVQARCDVRAHRFAPVSELYAAYESWATEADLPPVSAKRFSMLVSQLPGVERRRTKTARLFMGIALAY